MATLVTALPPASVSKPLIWRKARRKLLATTWFVLACAVRTTKTGLLIELVGNAALAGNKTAAFAGREVNARSVNEAAKPAIDMTNRTGFFMGKKPLEVAAASGATTLASDLNMGKGKIVKESNSYPADGIIR